MSKLVLAAIAGCVSLAGCAPTAYTKANLDGLIVCNADTMEAVERKARRTFAHVYWVNCPQGTLRVI